MNSIDLVLLVIIAASALLAAFRGFVGTIASIVAWLGAGWCAFRYGAQLAYVFSGGDAPGATELLGGYVVAFIAVLVLVGLVSWVLRKLLSSIGLGGVDRLLGAALGALRGGLVACMLVLVMAFSRLPQEPAWGQSQLVPVLVPGAQWLARWLPEWASEELDFGNGRASSDNARPHQGLVERSGALIRAVRAADAVAGERKPEPAGAESPVTPSPSNPGH
jgi:membrane protein required for colicin V production